MVVIRSYRNGMSMASGKAGNPHPEKRGEIRGWTANAARRQRLALYSVESTALTGTGWAITLTLRTLPTSEEWQSARAALMKRIERLPGWLRSHWVVEWQERGHPHLHLAVYGDGWDVLSAWLVVGHWMEVAVPWGPSLAAQYVTPITGPVGWLEYLSKHAARGAKMYQRAGRPEGWEKTGRLYGFRGTWPFEEPEEFYPTRDGAYRYRRLARSWRIADARAELVALPPDADPSRLRAARRRLTSARRALRCPDHRLSAVRGVSEWIPEAQTLALMERLKRDGQLLPAKPEEERTSGPAAKAARMAAAGADRLRADEMMRDLGWIEVAGA